MKHQTPTPHRKPPTPNRQPAAPRRQASTASRQLLTLSCLLLTHLAGCATHADRLVEVRDFYYGGHVDWAEAKIDEYLKRGDNDVDVLKLDRAVVQLAAGHPQEAERTLREVRDRFDYLQQASAVEAVASMLFDANQKSYHGEDYERVLIRALLALSNLMGDGGDALAYALQINDLQEQIIQNGTDPTGENRKLAYKRVAFGAYLGGALREATYADFDDAARNWARVVSWEPQFPFGRADLDRAQRGHHSERGNGVVYVFTLVGRGPCKIEVEEIPGTVAMLVADRILSATAKHTVAPTIAPIKVPKVIVLRNQVLGVQVSVDGRPAGGTATITDVGQLAVQQYDAIYPRVIGEAVARRVVKKGVMYGAKEALKVSNNSLLNIGLDVLGVVWEATESADTRCWGLLPDKIQVLRLELPAGQHRIGLRSVGGYGPMSGEEAAAVTVEDGRNTYLLANFPTDRLAGKILVSEPR